MEAQRKRSIRKSKPATQKEGTYANVEEIKATPEDKNPWKDKDAKTQKVCKQCGQLFLAKNPKKKHAQLNVGPRLIGRNNQKHRFLLHLQFKNQQ